MTASDTTRARYEAAGMKSFSYQTSTGRVQVRRYFELPEDVLSDPDELRVWARESMSAAARNKTKTKRPARRIAG